MKQREKSQEAQANVVEKTLVKKSALRRAKQTTDDVEDLRVEMNSQVILDDLHLPQFDEDSVLTKDYNIEDFLKVLQTKSELSVSKQDAFLDNILKAFDIELEERGLGDDYFQNLEKGLKEMELDHLLHELAIDEMLKE